MRIGIIGTGAVGGFFGAKLKLAGNDVVFLSRGETLKMLKSNGLTLETKEKTSIIKDAIFTDNPSELTTCKYILVTVKSYDTKSAINQIKDYLDEDALVITPQNGINNDILLSEVLGNHRVIPGLAKGGYSSPKPGFIKNLGFAILMVGAYDGKTSSRLKEFVDICNKAGIETILSNNIQIDRWKKYTWNCTFNIISSITRLRVDQMLNNSKIRDLCVNTMKEIILIANKEGVILSEEDTIREEIVLAEKLGTFKTSTLQDIENGKRIELEAFTGYILELAQKHNLEIPINEILYDLLYGIASAK